MVLDGVTFIMVCHEGVGHPIWSFGEGFMSLDLWRDLAIWIHKSLIMSHNCTLKKIKIVNSHITCTSIGYFLLTILVHKNLLATTSMECCVPNDHISYWRIIVHLSWVAFDVVIIVVNIFMIVWMTIGSSPRKIVRIRKLLLLSTLWTAFLMIDSATFLAIWTTL